MTLNVDTNILADLLFCCLGSKINDDLLDSNVLYEQPNIWFGIQVGTDCTSSAQCAGTEAEISKKNSECIGIPNISVSLLYLTKMDTSGLILAAQVVQKMI